MEDFVPTIPTGNALLLFLFCLAAGGYVIYRFCLDRFDKPTASTDDRCPWKFVVLRYQTTPRQYLIGFTIYCGSMMLIFLSVSIVGPAPFFQIMKAMAAAATQTDMPAATDTAAAAISLQNYPTFPILVAFYLVGLNPNLPKALDFEINLRSLRLLLELCQKAGDLTQRGIRDWCRDSLLSSRLDLSCRNRSKEYGCRGQVFRV